ncbi:SPOC domain-like protein [Lentinus tigrinus ALCF2SS1-7]|uniref:ATP-dependent DNA helicase II subunit 2 n=1 Tax=Lentinus tigrinus ALCF2SS1-6 TaxID=1328759 RepID=A0A5C2S8L2_9APHY|nr:SPOC domain-like protein [Lentinus tigrinus ALCF2SS1-6]RPD70774.1 SPOC domain-like protein [Lentinus tigrinus ALCF2SS1-7]
MPAERAGYTVTMFLVDTSPSMGKTREVELPGTNGRDPEVIEMTNLEWALQYVMLKIQEMIFNGRKTDKCGVIVFGSDETKNVINEQHGGYENVVEYIPIAQPNAGTLAKLAKLVPSTVHGEPIDALIVGIETQDRFLGNKKTWTRKMVLLTDGENPMEVEDWEATAKKMNELDISLAVVGVDFDDEELPFHEENKSNIKKENEEFYHTFTSLLENGVVGNCDFALQEISRPDVRTVKSTMMPTILRLGDTQTRDEEAIELVVKTSKCTALARPKSWKRFARRQLTEKEKAEAAKMAKMDVDEEKLTFAQLRMRTEYYIDSDKNKEERAPSVDGDGTDDEEERQRAKEEAEKHYTKVEKEELVRGYKYGASFAPAPEGGFPKLQTRKGMDICGFFNRKNFRRELSMGEVYYVWADPANPMSQVALSSIVQAMYEKGVIAISRWVSRDNMDPKMGVLYPTVFKDVDCFLWVQMPFAEDVRNFPFASLETLVNKKGEIVTDHPYLPTKEQLNAMEEFVDAMDLSDAGEKDEEGNREPWFDTRLSYNPAIHRTKQALFHGAVVRDLNTHPVPPPHPELLKYFEPPRRVLKRAREAIEECKKTFNVREVPKKVVRVRKDDHVRAPDEDEDMLLLDQKGSARPGPSQSQRLTQGKSFAPSQSQPQSQSAGSLAQKKKAAQDGDDDSSATEPEDEEDEDLLLNAPRKDRAAPLPTPARSMSPDEVIDRRRAPGRIVGASFPLEDFRKNISRGDVVTKAVEDLAFVIKDVISRPFASRRFDEMLECMHELRKVALQEDEIDAWNTFIRELRDTCMEQKPGNKAFWDKVRGIGRPLSYISDTEASRQGGKSDISESEAAKFIQE